MSNPTNAKRSHPPYLEMVLKAIAGLKERGGCSQQKIVKYIKANHEGISERVSVSVRKAIKKLIEEGNVKVGTGGAKKYVLTDAGKKRAIQLAKPKVVKKPTKPKKPEATKAKKDKKPSAKKPTAKASVKKSGTPKKKPAAKKASKGKSPAKKAPKKPTPKKVGKKPAAKPKKPAAKKSAKK